MKIETPHLNLFKEKLKRLCGESDLPVQVIKVKNEIKDYVPAYPLTNKLKFFDCQICGNKDKKVFRLNLKSFEAAKDKFNRLENTIELRTYIIYLCCFHFELNFSRFEQMIDDCNNDRFDKYEFAKN